LPSPPPKPNWWWSWQRSNLYSGYPFYSGRNGNQQRNQAFKQIHVSTVTTLPCHPRRNARPGRPQEKPFLIPHKTAPRRLFGLRGVCLPGVKFCIYPLHLKLPFMVYCRIEFNGGAVLCLKFWLLISPARAKTTLAAQSKAWPSAIPRSAPTLSSRLSPTPTCSKLKWQRLTRTTTANASARSPQT